MVIQKVEAKGKHGYDLAHFSPNTSFFTLERTDSQIIILTGLTSFSILHSLQNLCVLFQKSILTAEIFWPVLGLCYISVTTTFLSAF